MMMLITDDDDDDGDDDKCFRYHEIQKDLKIFRNCTRTAVGGSGCKSLYALCLSS
jgi:hypothetical protein